MSIDLKNKTWFWSAFGHFDEVPTCLWHHFLFSFVSHGPWKVPCSACSLLSCFCSFCWFMCIVWLAWWNILNACLAAVFRMKVGFCDWLRWRFYTCFVKNFSRQMLHLFEAILSLYSCCSLYELYLATTHVSNTFSNNQKDQSQWNVKCYCNASVSSASDRQKHICPKWEKR